MGGGVSSDYVDLGLPSGLLWAKKNLGADTEEDAGLYFQWGDTQGYTAEQLNDNNFTDWSGYKFGEPQFTKYNVVDDKTVLDLEDDAVHAAMGGNCRMPTGEEFAELINNTNLYLVPSEGAEIKGNVITDGAPYNTLAYFEWEQQPTGNIKGMKFYKKNDSSVYMFVPSLYNEYGCMWSSSIKPTSAYKILFAYSFRYNKNDGTVYNNDIRYNTLPIRGVLDNN